MITRKRNSPGIEINEIDRSQYNTKPDFSTVGTTTFICGFADKGPNYSTEWINSIKTLQDIYGNPTNEVERYFYNSAIEILNKGGVLFTSKLPYNNLSKDKYAQVNYKIEYPEEKYSVQYDTDDTINNEYKFYLSALKSADTTLKSYAEITTTDDNNSLIDLTTYDNYKTHETVIRPNTLKIVDITQKQYETIDMLYCDSADENKQFTNNTEEFIGIMPVIVSPMNAMFFQQVISSKTEVNNNIDSSLSGQEITENISAFNVINNAENRYGSELLTYITKDTYNENFELLLSAQSINDASVSKIAASYFPNINYINKCLLDRKYLKQIGIVVFQLFKDVANNKKLNFSVVEAFVGSLNKDDKDPVTKSSIFIDNVVNENSKYINVFSNIQITQKYKDATTFLIKNQTAKILGYKQTECVKNIDYVESIINPLNRIFDTNQDPNIVAIDIVCDAGVSNIAQFVKSFGSYSLGDQVKNSLPKYNAETYPNIWYSNSNNTNRQLWKLTDGQAGWKTVLEKYDTFCKSTRKDCIFLADVLRPFCLNGNEKIVRTTNLKNTIENSIIPNLKYVLALNSSYSAGYCDWYYIKDYFSDELFWLPPSIKAAGVCNYIDTYFHTWDAPAGVIRGRLDNVLDVAFSPRNDEAGKLYQNAWNYAINYPIDGIAIEGQKTFQHEQTALDRINVRRLMIYLEKQVRNIARHFIYEGNTSYLRQKFVDTIRPIFEDAKNSYGIVDYAIRCDDTNNTAETIDRNELRCAIAVKPVKTIEWIICDFIVTNQSANVIEEVMKN